MSREFRWVGGQYFHGALEEASAPGPTRHPISEALSTIYGALAPLERACASYEAYDASAARTTMALQEAWPTIEAAFGALSGIQRQDRELIAELLERQGERP
ncbi:hypothetical protein Mpop_2738 [Methylorubrum populi BJ001]|uniref:Uncharacterized protein n=1 Tax=Methylorubrum populi (strain ATCC BAA-705 / NCIMB 13946 / BJ001) TaxID=441620 RepID=B1ZD24_METPB|nr:hypothetical protein [Methylorubrum populi]ACB80893.1 hypothetical protein Mpop_2738 [Methylorubrum populi BJ001]